jgi:hypothetical protein
MGRLAYQAMSARGHGVTDETLADHALCMRPSYDYQRRAYAESAGVGGTFTPVTRFPGTEADP